MATDDGDNCRNKLQQLSVIFFTRYFLCRSDTIGRTSLHRDYILDHIARSTFASLLFLPPSNIVCIGRPDWHEQRLTRRTIRHGADDGGDSESTRSTLRTFLLLSNGPFCFSIHMPAKWSSYFSESSVKVSFVSTNKATMALSRKP